jgi:hypothetical protein
MRLLVGIVAGVIAAGAAHAHDAGKKVTANRPAVACQSWETMARLVSLMSDTAAFANFYREQKRTGECRTFAAGEQVVVEQDMGSVGPDGKPRAKMSAHPVGDKRRYWTYPGWFD